MPSRWCWFCQTCRSRFWVPLSPFCCSSAVASCWPACSTTTSWHSTSDPTSGRSSGLCCCSFLLLIQDGDDRLSVSISKKSKKYLSNWGLGWDVLRWDFVDCVEDHRFFPSRYFVKPSCAEEKLPPHYPISQPTLRLVEQILTLHRWSNTNTPVLKDCDSLCLYWSLSDSVLSAVYYWISLLPWTEQ